MLYVANDSPLPRLNSGPASCNATLTPTSPLKKELITMSMFHGTARRNWWLDFSTLLTGVLSLSLVISPLANVGEADDLGGQSAPSAQSTSSEKAAAAAKEKQISERLQVRHHFLGLRNKLKNGTFLTASYPTTQSPQLRLSFNRGSVIPAVANIARLKFELAIAGMAVAMSLRLTVGSSLLTKKQQNDSGWPGMGWSIR